MNKVDQLAKALKDSTEIKNKKKTSPYDTNAKVVRVDGNIAWVAIDGGVPQTPATMVVNAKEGDNVRVGVGGGKAYVTGNASAPPTDDARANEVMNITKYSVDFVEMLRNKDITVRSIESATGYIDDLHAKNITTENLQATNGYIENLTAKNITAEDISADHATVDTLDVNYAQIDMANVNNAWIEHGAIKKAEVFDENVFDLSGNRATLSRIDASKINVANLRADNLVVRRINGQPVVGGYTLISNTSPGYESKNPQELGWYEFVNAQWVLSTDTTVDMTKAYYQEGDEVSLYDQAYIDGLENDLQQQIDGAVETFTGSVVPTLVNYPYTDWYDTSVTPVHDERAKHVGDIYYVTNSTLEEDGYAYRFTFDETQHAYDWVLIKDSAVTRALSDISELQTFESETTSWIDETDEGLETIRINHTALSGVVDKTVKESVQLWFTKANTTAPAKPTAEVTSTSTAGNAWRKVVPAWNASYPNYYYCWQYKFVDGTFGWSDVVRDIAMGETQGTARDAKNTADNALPASTFTTFESTTFKNVKDTVDEQTTKFTNMTTRLGLNADGTEASTDIVNRESALEQTVNGISSRVGKTEMHLAGMYATSSTAAGTAAKVATIVPSLSNYELANGAMVTVKFTAENTAASPTLNLNGTGAKAIKTYSGGNLAEAEYKWKAGSTFTFTYNGTNWLMQDSTASVRMNTAETEITQNAEAIVLEASRRESAVNLLLDSDAPTLTKVYAPANRYYANWASGDDAYCTASIVEMSDSPSAGSTYAVRVVATSGHTETAGRGIAFYDRRNVTDLPLKVGTKYTASCWARKTSGSAELAIYGRTKNGGGTTFLRETLTSEWKYYTCTVELESTPDYNRLYFEGVFLANTAGTVEMCGFKLVAGENVEAYKSSITQSADKIALVVESGTSASNLELTDAAINAVADNMVIKSSTDNSKTVIQGGKLYADQIEIGSLAGEIGGRNLLVGTGAANTWTISLNSSNYQAHDCYQTCSPVPSLFAVNDLVTISFDWSTNGTSGNFHVECGKVTPYTWGTVVNAVGTRSATSNYVDITSSNKSGHVSVTFKITSSQTSAAETLQWLRIRVDGADMASKTFTVSNAKVERGSKATDWTPAPEDVDEEIGAVAARYGICSTAAATAAKTVTIDGFKLVDGATISVRFTNGNSVTSAVTLNVNSTGAKTVNYNGSTTSIPTLLTYAVVGFVYDSASSYWRMTDSYAGKTATSYITKIDDAGIFVSPSDQSPTTSATGNSLKINGDGVYLYNGGVEQAYFTGTAAAIGTVGKDRIIINSSGLNVYNYISNSQKSVASFGATARIGISGQQRVEIAPSGIDMYGYNANASPTTQNLCHIGFDSGNAQSGQAIAPYYTFGTRKSGSSIGNYSVAEGYNTTASHWASHAEGGGTKASSNYTHAEGSNTTASAMYAHAEGFETTASDVYAHAEGYGTKATNDAAHAEGYETQANGYGSHAQNVGTVANGTAQTVIGKYNVADTTSLFIIGNGNNEGSRKNLAVVTDAGDLYLKGNLYVGSNDAGTSGTKANSGIDIASKITFGSAWTQQVRVARRIGNMVFFQLEANAGTFNANTNYVIANIASGYRPAVQQFATGITTDGSYNPKGTVSAVLKTDGSINIRTQTASSSGAFVFISGFYYTA